METLENLVVLQASKNMCSPANVGSFSAVLMTYPRGVYVPVRLQECHRNLSTVLETISWSTSRVPLLTTTHLSSSSRFLPSHGGMLVPPRLDLRVILRQAPF